MTDLGRIKKKGGNMKRQLKKYLNLNQKKKKED